MDDSETTRFLEALGHEVMAMRVKRRLSREQVAVLARVSERQVGKIERGERGQVSEAWRVARVLNVDLSWLVAEAEKAVRPRHRGESELEYARRQAAEAREAADKAALDLRNFESEHGLTLGAVAAVQEIEGSGEDDGEHID